MIYAKKDIDGKLIQSIHTKEELGEPWILVTQADLRSGMVWDADASEFVIPPEPEPTPDP